MTRYSKQELEDALRAVSSLLAKCRKAQQNLPRGTPQHTLTKNRIAALRISKALIQAKLRT